MCISRPKATALVTALLCCANASWAATLWNEGVSGDLSNDRANPTQLNVVDGSNLLSATSGGPGPDREYFRFTVPAGFRLTKVVLNDFTTVFDGKAFIGVQAGPVITVDPLVNPSPAPLLGYAHFGPDVHIQPPAFDYLPEIGIGSGAIGFTGPLGPGQYSFWTQQTSAASPSTYELDFVLEPIAATAAAQTVPMPLWALALQALAMGAIGIRSRLGTRTRS